MAEDLRNSDTSECLTDERTVNLVEECRRQEESCLYSSTTLYIWLRHARIIRNIFIVTPLILGAIATWSILDASTDPLFVWLTATSALLAGLFPAIFEALNLNTHVASIAKQAATFKSLQDRFRQLATVTSLGSYNIFHDEFREAMLRMDEVRATSITPPERYFKAAQKKIAAGDYTFNVDQTDTN